MGRYPASVARPGTRKSRQTRRRRNSAFPTPGRESPTRRWRVRRRRQGRFRRRRKAAGSWRTQTYPHPESAIIGAKKNPPRYALSASIAPALFRRIGNLNPQLLFHGLNVGKTWIGIDNAAF